MRGIGAASIGLLAAATWGCGGDAASTGEPGASATAAVSASAATPDGSASSVATGAATAPLPGPAHDPNVVKLLKAIAAGCDVDEQRASYRGCRQKEDEALGRYIDEKKPTALYATAAWVATGEGASRKKLFAVAVNTFNRLPSDADLVRANATPAAASAVLELLPLVGDDMDAVVAQGAAAVVLLAGKRAELTALVQRGGVKKRVGRAMWTWYLKYGGADAIPDLELALQSDDKIARYNAASAPSAAISTLSADDKVKACEFAKRAIATVDDDTIGAAADSLATCGGDYSDAALDVLEKKTVGPTVSTGVIHGLYHQCWARGVVGGKVNGTKAQCDRALDALVRITAIQGLDAPTLATTLWALGSTGRNGGPDASKKAKATLAKFVGHKDKGVQEKAKADYSK